MAGEQAGEPPREVSPEDKALSAEWQKRIEAALARPGIKEAHKRFEENRKLLRGVNRDGTKMAANLYFANLASMRPQVYAKDPEYACAPARGVPEEQLTAVRKFCETAETLLTEELVKKAKLKKRAKRLLTSAYTTSVGWWKLCWQEDKKTDPLIVNKIKDVQDNLQRIEMLQEEVEDPSAGTNVDVKKAELEQTLAGLQAQSEATVSRGLTLDFVMSEDIVILDSSVRELGDYERASAIAHRVWMGRESYKARFNYTCDKGKSYSEQSGQMANTSAGDKKDDLLCVWEIWDQDSNRVFCVCDGEEGFCEPPNTPDWTGERWFPFFLTAFNEIEGTFYPLSDIELTQPQVEEINQTAVDFKRDRKAALPLNVARKGGSLTDEDLKHIRDREGSDLLLIEGIGTQPLSNDIWSGQLAQLKPENYDTTQARSFMEQIIGGGDAARGSVLKAKTATEAEILSQGLRSRSSERQDTMEDMLTEVGSYALQILLRKLSPQDVMTIAGPDAQWPTLQPEQIFKQVTVEVRGGSTGKPDRLQEQDRWTKLLPVIEKTVQQVAELRLKGQGKLAEALIELTRETLRRFDERLDLDQFLPPAPEEGQADPEQMAQELQMAKAKVEEMGAALQDAQGKAEKGYIAAAAQVATSANPMAGAEAFGRTLQTLVSGPSQEPGIPMQTQPDPMVQELSAQLQDAQQQLAAKDADVSAEVEKARLAAVRDVEIARVKAPIEAEAKVQVALVTAQAQEAAQQASATAGAEQNEVQMQTQQLLHGLLESHETLRQGMQEISAKAQAPKPAMRLAHRRGPDGRIAESVLVPVEEANDD